MIVCAPTMAIGQPVLKLYRPTKLVFPRPKNSDSLMGETTVSAPPKVDDFSAAKNDNLRMDAHPLLKTKIEAKKIVYSFSAVFVEISVTPISTLVNIRTTSDPALKSGTFHANLSHSMQIEYAG